ncbi:MAG: glycosyltransferase family 2 protein [Chthoniobacterales bacterium]
MVRVGGAVGASKKLAPLLSDEVCTGGNPWQIGAVQTSFLVPAYNEEHFVGRAVESVHRAAAACDLTAYEVVVCDNGSTDATAAVARAAGARVVQEPHRQIARSRNAAATASSGSWLVWLDADAMLTAEVLGATLSALDSGRVCGGGARVELEGAPLDRAARCAVGGWNWIAATFRLAAGSYFFSLRGGWAETGGFNEAVYAGEEIGFSRTLKRWGRRRGLHFRVLEHAVPSSARKVQQFTLGQTLRQLAVCAWPGNLGRRDRCAFWYERPGDLPAPP